ncbi:hypothetical protein NM208_g4157 [Fusarium decemcellulare]|uniref:Uncharacterized protein n=1 Tax=Fusarium decemcellulare TaxID=57161 RepID=A0ACC1SM24_9HYPO|nr:hypothetical protein NM208_g4157 [Fusarium decemcellulare]
MPITKKLSSPELYTVAWIAALSIERAAATALLDDRHNEPEAFDQHSNDANSYDWGEIGRHNVVIASLPAGSYGTNSAAITASHLLSSLPHIRIGLLVGIGGGIPRPDRDIRLGDIVVSQPNGTNGGVVQYDLGKAKANQAWERKGALNVPPTVLLTALAKLQADHEIEDPGIARLLENMVSKYPKMRKTYVYQGVENDRLFSPKYDHAGGSTCDGCDIAQEVKRMQRETTDPEIHYGTVTSGNTLVKDAMARGEISQLVGEDCLCVEMEAAGLMNTFPCLAIRGVCDYADSHKNDQWQRYASATAAAFAVELLGRVPARQLQDTPWAQKMVESFAEVSQELRDLKEFNHSSYSNAVLDRLPIARGAAYDSSDSSDAPKCLENTRVDILREIYEWAGDPASATLFWLSGMAGTGKSTISRTVADRLAGEGNFGGSFFFKKGQTNRADPSRLFTTLAAGLWRWQPAVSKHIQDSIERNPQIFDQMYQDQFSKLILEPLSHAMPRPEQPIVMVVDALDECQHELITHIITDVLSLARHSGLKLFLTSRPELQIVAGFPSVGRKIVYEDRILQNVPRSVIDQDLKIFFVKELEKIRKRYSGMERLPLSRPGEHLIQRLVDMATPLFIVASTICRFVEDQKRRNAKRQMDKILDKILAIQDRTHETKLDQMYLTVLNQQFDDDDSTQQRSQTIEMFRRIVGSIVVLLTPLTIPALARLLQHDEDIDELQDAVETRLEVLHSVLSVPPLSERQSSPVRILHLSFRDFLVDCQHRDKNPFWVDETETHGILAQGCMRVMEFNLHQNICNLENPGVLRESIDQRTVDGCLSSEVQYACLHWIGHIEQARVDSVNGDEVLMFLKEHLLHWLEALSLMGRILESVEMVEKLKHATMDTACPGLSEFLDDAIRFVGYSARGIATAPLQVYSSALVFAPLESVIRRAFQARIPDWISSQPRVDDQWRSCLQEIWGPGGEVDSIVFSPDSRRMVLVLGSCRKLWLCDVKTGAELQVLEGHSHNWYQVSFSTDSTMLFIASRKHIRVRAVDTARCLRTLRHHGSKVSSMITLNLNLVASGSDQGHIQIWKADTGQQPYPKLMGHEKRVRALALSADQGLLASGSDDGAVRIWNTATWTLVKSLDASGHGGILTIALSVDSTLIACATYDTGCTMDIDDAGDTDDTDDTNHTTHTGDTDHSSTMSNLDNASGPVLIWAFESDQLLQKLHRDTETDTGAPKLMFRSESELIAPGNLFRSTKVWRAKTGELLHELGAEGNRVLALSQAHDRTLAVLGGRDNIMLGIWDVDTQECLQRFDARIGLGALVAMSPDARLIVSRTYVGEVKIWQVSLSNDPSKSTGQSREAYHFIAATSPDLSLAVSTTGSRNGSAFTVWRIATGEHLHQLSGQNDSLFMFSPDSKRLLNAGKRILVWDIDSGRQLLAREPLSRDVFHGAVFSPTSELLAAGCSQAVRIWRIDTGNCIRTIECGLERNSRALSFSPDSASIASKHHPMLKVWDIASGEQLLDIKVADDNTFFDPVAITNDLKLAATSDYEKVCVWQATTGKLLDSFETGDDGIGFSQFSFEADNTQIFTNSGLFAVNGSEASLPLSMERHVGIGTNLDTDWILWYGQRLLFIPAEFQGSDFARVQGSSVLLEREFEQVIVIGFSPEELTNMYKENRH